MARNRRWNANGKGGGHQAGNPAKRWPAHPVPRHIGRGRSNRRIKIEHDRALYRERNHIERFFGRLKINRAIATRYDQLAESFLSMVHIAAARYWLKFVHAA